MTHDGDEPVAREVDEHTGSEAYGRQPDRVQRVVHTAVEKHEAEPGRKPTDEGAASDPSQSPSIATRCPVDGRANACVRAAAADVAARGPIDLVVGGPRNPSQQRGCRDDLPGLAVPALWDVQLEPRLL